MRTRSGWDGTPRYLVTFYERWIADPLTNGVVVDYDELVTRPVDALRRIVEAAGIEAADEALQAAVASTMPRRRPVWRAPFRAALDRQQPLPGP